MGGGSHHVLCIRDRALTYSRSVKDQRRSQARLVYARIADISTYEPGEEVPGLMDGERMAAHQSGSVTNDVSAAGGLVWHAKTRVVRVSVEVATRAMNWCCSGSLASMTMG